MTNPWSEKLVECTNNFNLTKKQNKSEIKSSGPEEIINT